MLISMAWPWDTFTTKALFRVPLLPAEESVKHFPELEYDGCAMLTTHYKWKGDMIAVRMRKVLAMWVGACVCH